MHILLKLLCLGVAWAIVIINSQSKDETAAILLAEWFVIGLVYCVFTAISYHLGGLIK